MNVLDWFFDANVYAIACLSYTILIVSVKSSKMVLQMTIVMPKQLQYGCFEICNVVHNSKSGMSEALQLRQIFVTQLDQMDLNLVLLLI